MQASLEQGSAVSRAAHRLAPRWGYLTTLAICAMLGALYMPNAQLGLGALTTGLILLSSVVLSRAIVARDRARHARLHEAVGALSENDPMPVLTTDAEGRVVFRNRIARNRFGGEEDTLAATISRYAAAPAAVLRRLRDKADRKGAAQEEIATPTGHLRVIATAIGGGHHLWRIDEVVSRPGKTSAESMTMPMMTLSKAGTVLFMNDAMRRLLGGRRAHLDRIVTDLPLRDGDIHQIMAAEGPLRARVHVKSGSIGRSEVYVVPQTEQVPELSAGWDSLEILPVPVLRLSPDGHVLSSNRLAREMLSIGEGEDVFLGDLVEGLGRSVSDWLAETGQGLGELRTEFVRATRPREDVFLQVNLSLVREQGDRTVVAVLQDATKLKTMEAQFVQSQKMQAIGQLAGGVAHDFNNLLTAISGHCDLLMLRHDESDPDYADLVQIHQNANRAASLVGQLLAFSRKQTLKAEILDVGDVLDDLTHLLNRLVGEKVTLSLEHQDGMPPIRADKRQLEQVIMNLVVNARDAMPEGGNIRIESRHETLSEPYRRDRVTLPPGDYVVILVHDQGVGIPKDVLPKIFEPFYTTKRTGEGTGLGLSMVYGIIKQTGGYIFADSVVGSGTTFTLFFPAAAPEAAHAPAQADEAAQPRADGPAEGGVVLLVEDEAPVRAFAARALQMRGYTVIEAECAEDALKMLEDPGFHVDIFITDVIMPGMDGPSWVSEALKKRPDTRVIFVSGYAEENFAEQQARIPNSVFLPKPFSLSDLATTVSAQLH